MFQEPTQQTCSLKGRKFKYLKIKHLIKDLIVKAREERKQVVFEFLPSCFSVQVTLITSW